MVLLGLFHTTDLAAKAPPDPLVSIHPTMLLDLGHRSVTPLAIFQPPLVSPDGSPASANAGGSGSVTFTVTNPNAGMIQYGLTCSVNGSVTACSMDAATVVVEGSSGTANVIVYFTTGSAGTGQVWLTVRDPIEDVADVGHFDVTVSGAPTVTPKGTSLTFAASSSASEYFTVANPNSSQRVYSLSCSYSGFVTNCSGPSSLTVAANSSDSVSIGFTTGTTGSGTLGLTATANGLSDTGSYSIALQTTSPSLQLSLTTLTFHAPQDGTPPATQSVLVSNAGTGTFSWSASKNQSWLAISPVSGNPGNSIVVSVNQGGLTQQTYTGTVTVTAAGAANSPQAIAVSFTVDAPVPQPPLVTPDFGSKSATEGTANTATFTINNPNSWAVSYALSCSQTSPVTSCSLQSTSIVVAAHSDSTVYVNFNAGAPGSGAVWLTADGGANGSDTGNYAVAVLAKPVVTPNGGTMALLSSSTGTARFYVRNPTSLGKTYNLTCTYSVHITNCSVQSSVVVSALDSTYVDVTVTTGTAGNGVVWLDAADPAGPFGEGSYNVTVNVPPTLQVAPGSLTFQAVQGGQAPANQSLLVSNAGTGTFSWTASKNQSWLTITPASGNPGDSIVVSANPLGLTAQTYSGIVTVTSANALSSPQYVAVSFIVNPPASHPPVVTPDGGSASIIEGLSSSAQFTVQNIDSWSKTYALSCNRTGSIAACSPQNAQLAVGGNSSGPVTVNYTAGAAGTGSIWLTADGDTTGSDTGNITVTVFGKPVVTPNGGALSVLSPSGTARFTVKNPTTFSKTYNLSCTYSSAVTGCTTAPTVILNAGDSAAVDVTIAVAASGNGVVWLDAADPAGPFGEGSYNVQVIVAPSVTPDNGSLIVAADDTFIRKFAVTNPNGSGARTYALSCGRSGFVSTCTVQSNISVTTMDSVAVTFTTGSTGSGTLSLTATDQLGSYDTGAYVVSKAPTLSINPTTLSYSSVHGDAAPASQTVHVNNSGTGTFTWSATKGQTWLSIAPTSGSAGDSITVSINQSGLAVLSYTDTITVTAAGQVGSPKRIPVTFSLNAPPPPIVLPPGGTLFVKANSTGTGVFTVKNQTSVSRSYSLTCLKSGAVANCSTPASRVIGGGVTDTVLVDITTTTAGTGGLWLRATDPAGPYAEGNYTVKAISPPTVLPKNMFANIAANTSSSKVFTIKNPNSDSITYTLSCTHTRFVATCGAPASHRIANGATVSDTVTFATTAADTGTLTLKATDPASSFDIGSYKVSSMSGPIIQLAPTTITFRHTINTTPPPTQMILVTNSGQGTFSWKAIKAQAWLTLSPDSGNAGTSISASVNPSGLSAQTYSDTVTVTAAGTTNSPQKVVITYIIDPVPPQVGPVLTVAPTAISLVTTTGGTANQTLQISNTGNSGSFTWTATKLQNQSWLALSATTGTPPSAITLTGTAGSLQPGLYRDTLRIDAPGAQNTGKKIPVTLTVQSSGAPTATIANASSALISERSLCLTIAAGPGAAYECGDLRLVRTLPATRTMNKLRAPTLLYLSSTAEPSPRIPIDVVLPSFSNPPLQLKATLTLSTGTVVSATWPVDSAWLAAPTQTRRVLLSGTALGTLATGVWDYDLSVGLVYDSIIGERWTPPMPGKLMMVNRRKGAFGAGWALAGLEKLVFLPRVGNAVAPILWISGDGSAHVYTALPTDSMTYVGPAIDRPDTLRRETSQYVRILSGGSRIIFDLSGRHITTINRLGHQTSFAFVGSSDTIQTITLPVPSGSAARQYGFTYPAGKAIVQAPSAGTQVRVDSFAVSGNKMRVMYDAAGRDSLAYSANRVTKYFNHLNMGTTFAYDNADHLKTSTLAMPLSADNIIHKFTAAETLGETGPSVIDSLSLTTLYDGPRKGSAADTTRFWLDNFGAPSKIKNALGEITTLLRADQRFPALVTEVIHPNGFREQATYNTRGNIDSQTQISPYGNGVDAISHYEYAEGAWPDFVTRITPPEGDCTEFGYDITTGNRVWQQDCRGQNSRVGFRYYSSGNVAGLLSAVKPALAPSDSVVYDTNGNLAASRTAKGYWTYSAADAAGRDTLVDTPIDNAGLYRHKQRILYDALGRDTLNLSIAPAYYGAASDTVVVRKTYNAESSLTSLPRRSGPDLNNIGWSTTTWAYDSAGRRVREIAADNKVDAYTYDPAGNMLTHVSRDAARTVTMQYDALNRLVLRKSLEDTARFAYNSLGLTAATNRYARVTRKYYPGGALELDTLRIQESTLVALADSQWTGYNTHVYGLRYTYDRNGRRTSLQHPETIRPQGTGVRSSVQYFYDPNMGALTSIEGIGASSRFDFLYNYDNQLTTVLYPAGITENRAYDADGRLLTRQTWAPAGGWIGAGYIRDDSLVYDARDKVVVALATKTGSNGIIRAGTTSTYNGAGHLDAIQDANSQYFSEGWTVDALGNQWLHGYSIEPGNVETTLYYKAGVARLDSIIPADSVVLGDTLRYLYDDAGRQKYARETKKMVPNPLWPNIGSQFNQYIVETNSFFNSEGKLTETRRLSSLQESAGLNTHEYYRYDALGRRIWRRAQNGWDMTGMTRDSLCTRPTPSTDCKSFVERTVWDGDQVLYEIRARAEPGASRTITEDDQTPFDPHFGRVTYTNGAAIDQPLEIVRSDWEGNIIGVPHANWRGTYDMITFTTPDEHEFCGPEVGWPLGNGECYPVDFSSVTAFGQTDFKNIDGTETGPRSWFGNVINGNKDASGLMYRRNRYYDPKQGRFTQEDPIGLAGGNNLYGFAGGDPINFSDPFGLWDDCRKVECPKSTAELVSRKDVQRYAKQLIHLSDTSGGIEYGAFLVKDKNGRVTMTKPVSGEEGGVSGMRELAPDNAIAEIHTHPDKKLSGGETLTFEFVSGEDATRANAAHVYGIVVTPRNFLVIPVDKYTFHRYPR